MAEISQWELVKVLQTVSDYPIKRSELVKQAQKLRVSRATQEFFESIPNLVVKDNAQIIDRAI